MTDLSPKDAYLLELVCDPNSKEFQELYAKLIEPADDGRSRAQKLRGEGEWRYVLPFRGEPEDEIDVRDVAPVTFSERASYRNGVYSLSLVLADMIDLIELYSKRHRITTTLVVTAESQSLLAAMGSTGSASSMVFYCNPEDVVASCLSVRPEVVLIDHTTVNFPVDEFLNMAFRMGVHVVDGVFPYHVAAVRGWDVVTRVGKWSYTHSDKHLTVGPDDDCSRLIKYTHKSYSKFVDPAQWEGAAKNYGYEIRRCRYGLATYRAVYLDSPTQDVPSVPLEQNLPLCSSDDMILLTINRDLAAGVYASSSNNASQLARVKKDYAIEVRKDLFQSCVSFLISRDKGTDIVGEAARYISQHNYVDLVEGVRIVRSASLQYADALCVSVVCALTAFSLRYRLTNDSIPDIARNQTASRLRNSAPFGMLGRIAWLMGIAVADKMYLTKERTLSRAREVLFDSSYIPSVTHDLYMSNSYVPEMNWFEANQLVLEDTSGFHNSVYDEIEGKDDPLVGFLGDTVKTSAPTVFQDEVVSASAGSLKSSKYVPNVIPDPLNVLQEFYDHALPGNSTTQLQNVAEYRRVKDVNLNVEFYGRIEINKDVAAPEKLHKDMPLRTAALPTSATPLLDAIMASAKRNFNPPDLQMQSDPWTFARYLVDKFIKWAFVPRFAETLGRNYKRDLISFNVTDYFEWRATRDKAYLSALEAECPNDLVELGLERYDTIVKKRIKPKLSTASQYELAQPQVIVSLSKKDTAPFTSVFRKIFERFDHALRPELKSAGRSSDADISSWLTKNIQKIVSLPCAELDSSKYDKSQNLLARMLEALIMQELGLDPGVSEIFEDSHVGKVSSKTLGLFFTSAYQMKSGAPHTMLGNIIYNAVSAMESIGTQNIAMMLMKGDDNLVWVYPDTDLSQSVEKMSGLFNLEAKLITRNVPYFSSGYVVPFDDRAYFVPDLLKMTELLGEDNHDEKVVFERFCSFQDRVSALLIDDGIPSRLQQMVRIRLGIPDLGVVAAIDALAAVASSYSLYRSIVCRN